MTKTKTRTLNRGALIGRSLIALLYLGIAAMDVYWGVYYMMWFPILMGLFAQLSLRNMPIWNVLAWDPDEVLAERDRKAAKKLAKHA